MKNKFSIKNKDKLIDLLEENNVKFVLAESCTCGLVAAIIGGFSGISNYFCGSSVVYRENTKKQWLEVSNKKIKKYSTESLEMASIISKSVLKKTLEANFSLGIVGDIESSNKEKDGIIYVCIRCADSGKSVKLTKKLEEKNRINRQKEAAYFAINAFVDVLENFKNNE